MGEVETIVDVTLEVRIVPVCHAILTTVNILECFLSFMVLFI